MGDEPATKKSIFSWILEGAMKEFGKGLGGFLAGVILATPIAAYVGNLFGSFGKNPGFDAVATDISLNDSTWTINYEDDVPTNSPNPKTAKLTFKQKGSRIVGKGEDLSDASGRTWIIEGACAARRVSYIYRDSDPNKLSFGAALMEMNSAGTKMTGQWIGWTPDDSELKPRKLTVTRTTGPK